MASTFSQTLRLELIGDGDQSGIWGQTTNTNLGTLLEQAITGVVNITMTDANYTLTNFNGVSDEARNAVLVVGGTNNAVRDVIAPLVKKLYVVNNSTVGGYAINIRGSSGAMVSVPNGAIAWVYCDGTNFNAIGTESLGNFEVNGNLTVTGNSSVAGNSSVGGNLTFTGTSQRIAGDFQSITRPVVQSNVTGYETAWTAIPATSGTSSNLSCTNSPDMANASYAILRVDNSTASVLSFKTGTGTYLPLNFNVNNAERMRITTNGGISFGSSGTNYGTAGQVLTSTGNASPTWSAPFPSGGIIMWSGSIASIPSGWLLCDGTNGTPDLRSRFVVGAGSTYAVNATGGSADATLVAHTHTYSGSSTTSGQSTGHTHAISDPGHSHATNYDYASNQPGAVDCNVSGTPTNIFVNGTQSAFTGITGTQNVSNDHTHNYSWSGTTASSGSSATNANLPPYFALAYIMKS